MTLYLPPSDDHHSSHMTASHLGMLSSREMGICEKKFQNWRISGISYNFLHFLKFLAFSWIHSVPLFIVTTFTIIICYLSELKPTFFNKFFLQASKGASLSSSSATCQCGQLQKWSRLTDSYVWTLIRNILTTVKHWPLSDFSSLLIFFSCWQFLSELKVSAQ